MIASPTALREAGFRREFSTLPLQDKDALVRRLLIEHIGNCKVFDVHKLRCVQKLVESIPSPLQKKK